MITLILLLNLAVTTSILVFLAWPKAKTSEAKTPPTNLLGERSSAARTWLDSFRRSRFKPIKHEPLDSPEVPVSLRMGGAVGQEITASYFRPKGQPDAATFVATHYPLPNAAKNISHPDTYVDEQGVQIPGQTFRLAFEPAAVVRIINRDLQARSFAKARNRTVIRETENGQVTRTPVVVSKLAGVRDAHVPATHPSQAARASRAGQLPLGGRQHPSAGGR